MTRPTGRPPGRPKGRKNNKTIERSLMRERTFAERDAIVEGGIVQIMSARRAGQKLAKEVLEDLMNEGMAVCRHYRPALPGGPENEHADETKYWQAANFTKEVATALAAYQSPKFKAIMAMVTPAPPVQETTPTVIGPSASTAQVVSFREQQYRRMLRVAG